MENSLTVKVDEQVAKQKEATWAQFGRGIYTTELKLQAIAQDAILKAKVPTTIAEVKAAEEQLKVLKQTRNSLEAQRKEITSRFDAKSADLMLSEKSLDDPIKKINDACIALKREEEKKQAAEAAKQAEIKAIREAIQKELAFWDAAFKTKIANQIAHAYQWALNNDVKPGALADYVAKCAVKFTANDFVATYNTPRLQYIDVDTFDKIFKELFIIDWNGYLQSYGVDLKKRFEHYEIEYNNKAAALSKAKADEEAALAKIKEDEANKTVAATLEGSATILTAGPDVKALKKSYKIQMEENEVNAMLILRAFIANLALCKSHVRITKWFNFGVSNMIVALEKVKNSDNGFKPEGVIFAEVDKL